ncbi:hypothetical protein QE152_g24628 [Popillia japonica]|uniref:Uncharacterized protein n=1 Tax=Popillia japonica TaxID=7064 RepID=A0AAW1K6G2_POPJA
MFQLSSVQKENENECRQAECDNYPPAKERLRGYFRFSNRKLRQSCETVITAAGTPAPSARTMCPRDGLVHHSIIDEGQSDNSSFQHEFSSS